MSYFRVFIILGLIFLTYGCDNKTDDKNSPPVANNSSLETDEDTSANAALSAADSDGDDLSYSIVANGKLGTAVITDTSTGTYTYTPNDHANGLDYFSFRVNDGAADSNTAIVTVTINAVNDIPTVQAGPDQTVDEGDTVQLAPATFTDIETDQVHSSTIDWGDGSGAQDAVVTEDAGNGTISATHVYTDNALYTVEVCVTDNVAAAVCDQLQISVNNVAPAVDAIADPFKLYGFIGNQFVSIDAGSGAATAIGDPSTFTAIQGLSYDPASKQLYAVADAYTFAAAQLIQIDQETGAATLVGTISSDVTLIAMEALAFNPVDGTLWGAGSDTNGNSNLLMTIDPLTGDATTVAAISGMSGVSSGNEADAMVIAGDGTMYVQNGASGAVSSDMYTLNTTGEASRIGQTIGMGIHDMAFLPMKGLIYATAGSERLLVKIWQGSAVITTVGATHTESEYGGERLLALASAPGIKTPISNQTLIVDQVSTLMLYFTDPGSGDSFTAFIDWGEGGDPQPATIYPDGPGAGYLIGKHIYTATGAYTAQFCVVDDDGDTGCGIVPVQVFDPADGLVAYYPFNGNANDESGNGNDGVVNGTVNGGAALTTDRFGNVDSAYSFDGVDDYILVADDPSLNPDSLSVVAWVKYGEAAPVLLETNWIVCKAKGSGKGYGIGDGYFNGGGRAATLGEWNMTLAVTSNDYYSASSNVSPRVGGWINVVGTYDKITNIAKIFINGKEKGSRVIAGAIDKDSNELTIGVHPSACEVCGGPDAAGPEWFLKSTIDDIRIYNRVLSSGEIAALYREQPTNLSNGLAANYPFNGNANDESGNGNNGTVNGAVLTADRFGNAGSAYDFDGVDDYVGIGDILDFEITATSSMSIDGWIKTSMTLAAGYIVNKMDILDPDFGWFIRVNDNGVLRFQFANDAVVESGRVSIDSIVVNDDQWHHFAATHEGSTGGMNLYLDGILMGSATESFGAIDDGGMPLRIGISSQGFWPFSGIIDDIRIYNRALTEKEIQTLFLAPQ